MFPNNPMRSTNRAEVKRRHFLETAWTVFSEQGYPNTSMDSVVAKAGGSKATLYTHFRSKEELLRAVLEMRGAEMRRKVFEHFEIPEGFVPSLRNFGHLYLDAIMNTDLIELYRIAMAEAKTLRTGGVSYAMAFTDNWKLVADFLDRNISSESFLAGGAWTAAMQLRGLIEGDLVVRKLSVLFERVSQKEIEDAVDAALYAFFRVYAPELCIELLRDRDMTA